MAERSKLTQLNRRGTSAAAPTKAPNGHATLGLSSESSASDFQTLTKRRKGRRSRAAGGAEEQLHDNNNTVEHIRNDSKKRTHNTNKNWDKNNNNRIGDRTAKSKKKTKTKKNKIRNMNRNNTRGWDRNDDVKTKRK